MPPHAFEGEKDHDDAQTHAREGQAKSEDVLERSAPRESSSKGKDLLYGLFFFFEGPFRRRNSEAHIGQAWFGFRV